MNRFVLGDVRSRRFRAVKTVAKNLRLGRFLTVIVGDRIRRSLVDMLTHVNRYPHLATDVALVELECYRWKREEDWPLVVVPSVVARTEIVERSVIQVTVKQDRDHQVDVLQERTEEQDRGRKRVSLTEEAYWELLLEQAPDDYADAAHDGDAPESSGVQSPHLRGGRPRIRGCRDGLHH